MSRNTNQKQPQKPSHGLSPEEYADTVGSLMGFSKYMFKKVKGSDFVENWHHEEICNALEKCVTGQITRLIINIPPRYSKTELAVVNFIAWTLGLFPDSELLHVSYGATLAENNSYNSKMLVEHEAYQALFPNLKLRNDSNARNKWMTERGGVVHAIGTSGTITGKGAGKLREGFAGAVIIDDPIKPTDAQSETIRPKVNEWFSSVLESRLNKKTTPVIVIMQRLHEDDLSGFLLNGGNGEEWTHLKIPAINEKGEALWPFKHNIDDLKRMENKNAYVFSGQYMQEPSPQGGGMLKEDWYNWYASHNLPDMKYTFLTADTALKTKEQNDYSVIQHWGFGVNEKLYLLNMSRGKWEAPDLEKEFKRFYAECSNKFRIRNCWIEDKASGTGLIQSLRREGRIPIRAVQRNTDKITRCQDASPRIEMGLVHLNKEIPQIEDMITESNMFPVGRHDDTLEGLFDAVEIAYYKTQGEAKIDYGSSSYDNEQQTKKRSYTNYG